MKKWSIISSLVVVCAFAVAAFATTGVAAAADPYHPYCPTGEEGTPPYCHPPTGPGTGNPGGGGGGGNTGGGGGGGTGTGTGGGSQACPAGKVGVPPNCVTPALDVNEVKVNPNSSTVSMVVNAPGKVKVSGKGIVSSTVSVSAGKIKVKIQLTPKEKEKLKEKGELKFKVKVTYTPKGGTPVTKVVKITVKAPGNKGSK